jgi:hypothetical protein
MLTLQAVRDTLADKKVFFSNHSLERLKENGMAEVDVFWGLEHADFHKEQREKTTGADELIIGWNQGERSFNAVFARNQKETVVHVVTAYEHNHNFYRDLRERKDFSMAENLSVIELPKEVVATKETKLCSRCHAKKALAEFYKNATQTDGLSYYCKTCQTELAKDYKERRPAKESTVSTSGQVRITVTDPDVKSLVAELLRTEGFEICGENQTSFAIEVEKKMSLSPKRKQEVA